MEIAPATTTPSKETTMTMITLTITTLLSVIDETIDRKAFDAARAAWVSARLGHKHADASLAAAQVVAKALRLGYNAETRDALQAIGNHYAAEVAADIAFDEAAANGHNWLDTLVG